MRFLLLITFSVSLSVQASAQEQGGDSASSQETAKSSLIIGGRPSAPLLDSRELPSPQKPRSQPPSAYGEIDAVDFLNTPELFLFDKTADFQIKMKDLVEEIDDLSRRNKVNSAASGLSPDPPL